MPRFSNKGFVTLFVVLFVISTTILLIASTADIPAPAWGGYLDVSVVVAIAVTGFAIYHRSREKPLYERSYQAVLYLMPLILVSMWIYRNAVDFNILLPGIAWRIYFFLSILPHALRLWKPEQQP